MTDARDELWQSFLETRVRVFTADAVTEIEIGDETTWAPGDAADLVHLITSWNPLGQQLPPEHNQARQEEFEAQLDASGLQWTPAEGVAVDGSWREAGAAVSGLTREAALDLARQWNQEAIYEWDPVGSLIAVVSCVDDRVWTRDAIATTSQEA